MQRRAVHKGAAVADGSGEGAWSGVSVAPSEGSGGKSHRRRWPMMRWGPALVCAAMGSERGRVAARLAWVTASCCGEILFLLKENFAERPSDRNTLIVDWGALPKTFEADMRRAERYVAIAGADAVTVGRVIAKVAGGERLATLGMGAVEKALRPCSATAHSIKRGAPAHAPAAVVERDLDPRILTQLGKHAGHQAAARHRAVPGTLGCRLERLREVDGPHEEGARGAAKLPWALPKAVGKDKAPRPLSNGRGVLGRTRITRVAGEEEQQRLALQEADVGTLSLGCVKRRLGSKALRCFGAVWRDAPQ
ncbi:hypothetical protein ERJ75_000045700 [Trypanosoma vivax]|nr:hypothetical protein ERJ75_000045700 [Trypanosoma vivax]